jgi:peptidoglycan/LPS O-acetylase OafA/YrhL
MLTLLRLAATAVAAVAAVPAAAAARPAAAAPKSRRPSKAAPRPRQPAHRRGGERAATNGAHLPRRASATARPEADRTKSASAANSAWSHRADIQGLRAVAVLLVVLGHAGVGFVSGGFVGVDVFFVVSGFLITGMLLTEARAHGRISLVGFYVRRARRLLPAAALTLLVTNVAALVLLNFVRAREAVHDGLHAAAFAANFRFADRGVDYFAQSDPPSPFMHYWSLSVEEQFYFVWPLLLALALFGVAALRRPPAPARRERRLLAVVIVIAGGSLVWSIHLTAVSPTAAYFSPLTRAWELGLGAAIAVGASALKRTPDLVRLVTGWVGLAAIACSAVLFTERTPFPGSAGLLPTAGTALAIVAGIGTRTPRLAAGRVLALRPLSIVGDRSYAFYLWHWPVLILAEAYVGHDLPVSVNLALVTVAFVLSCVSYALVENPIRRRVRSLRASVLVVAACTAALLGSATISLAGIDRAQTRFENSFGVASSTAPLDFDAAEPQLTAEGVLPAVVAAVDAARRGAPIPSGLTPRFNELRRIPPEYAPAPDCIGYDRSSQSATRICRMGDRGSRRLIVLIGDSHAMMWLPSLLEAARHDRWAVVPLLRIGCTPGKWVSARQTACRDWYRWATGVAARLRPQVIALAGSIGEQPTPFVRAAVDGMVAATRALKPVGSLVVIGDPESLDRNPVDCLLSRNASMATCTTEWPAASLVAYDDIARRVTRSGAGFLRTRGFVCFQRRCPSVIGRTIVWRDETHLTAAYGVQIAGPFRSGFFGAVAANR